MPCPSSIDVLGLTIPVSQKLMPDGDYGEWDCEKCEISISVAVSDDHRRVTLLHEACHAIDDLLDVGLSHKQVYILSQALLSFFRTNPKMIEWICEPSSFSCPSKPAP